MLSLADLGSPYRWLSIMLANSVVLISGYLATAAMIWGCADAMMPQPRDLGAFSAQTTQGRTWLPLSEGSEGELVLTHLVRDCQPLVRFRTGDIIVVDAIEPCRCGRTGFRFRVVGRSDDMVVVRGLNLFPTMVAAVLNEMPELSASIASCSTARRPMTGCPCM